MRFKNYLKKYYICSMLLYTLSIVITSVFIRKKNRMDSSNIVLDTVNHCVTNYKLLLFKQYKL